MPKPVKKTPLAEPKTTTEGTTTTETVVRKELCSIYYEKSITKNLGNYESAKVTFGVTLPIQPTASEIAEVKKTILVADEIITDELEVQLKDIGKTK